MNIKILSFCVIIAPCNYIVGEKAGNQFIILIPSYNNAAWYSAVKTISAKEFIHHSPHASYTQESSSAKDNFQLKPLSKL